MTSPSNPSAENYNLKRDYLGSSRLNLQFFLWNASLQFNLHPQVPKPRPGALVADIATGTGIWILETAKECSSDVQFHGFDISLQQTPPAAWLPPNVKLHEWDMFSEVPEEFVGVFDIVHVRLVMLVIKNDNAMPLIRNLQRLLKPGGYLQWDEVDSHSIWIEKSTPDLPSTTLETLFKTFALPKEAQSSNKWKEDLCETLNTNGFEKATENRYKDDPMLARYYNDLYLMAWDEFVSEAVGHSEKTRKLLSLAIDESRAGAAVMIPKTVWLAKKPNGNWEEDSTGMGTSVEKDEAKTDIKKRGRWYGLIRALGCFSS